MLTGNIDKMVIAQVLQAYKLVLSYLVGPTGSHLGLLTCSAVLIAAGRRQRVTKLFTYCSVTEGPLYIIMLTIIARSLYGPSKLALSLSTQHINLLGCWKKYPSLCISGVFRNLKGGGTFSSV